MTILSIYNRKGGSGKTTTTMQLAGFLRKKYKAKVLLVDADSQANLTKLLYLHNETERTGEAPNLNGRNTLTTVLTGDCKANQAIYRVYIKPQSKWRSSFDIIPVTEELDRIYVKDPLTLRKALEKMAKTRHYDYVLIDCPPALGEITANVLCASDYTLLPIDPGDEVDTSGLDSVQSFLDGLKASGNAKADILGFFINKFMKGDPVQEYNMQQISEVYKKWYIPITLPFHKYVSESRFYGLPLAWLHPRCQIGKLFEELATYVNDKTENKEG